MLCYVMIRLAYGFFDVFIQSKQQKGCSYSSCDRWDKYRLSGVNRVRGAAGGSDAMGKHECAGHQPWTAGQATQHA